jgi:hypothetical protein
MHSLEIPEGKLVSPFGVLGMLRINTQMPFCERFDSVRVNESIFLLGGRLILAPRVPIIPHQPPLAYQLFRERKSATTQFHCHGAPPKNVALIGQQSQRPISRAAHLMISAAKTAPCPDSPAGFSSARFSVYRILARHRCIVRVNMAQKVSNIEQTLVPFRHYLELA